jgi:hypothetical protein
VPEPEPEPEQPQPEPEPVPEPEPEPEAAASSTSWVTLGTEGVSLTAGQTGDSSVTAGSTYIGKLIPTGSFTPATYLFTDGYNTTGSAGSKTAYTGGDINNHISIAFDNESVSSGRAIQISAVDSLFADKYIATLFININASIDALTSANHTGVMIGGSVGVNIISGNVWQILSTTSNAAFISFATNQLTTTPANILQNINVTAAPSGLKKRTVITNHNTVRSHGPSHYVNIFRTDVTKTVNTSYSTDMNSVIQFLLGNHNVAPPMIGTTNSTYVNIFRTDVTKTVNTSYSTDMNSLIQFLLGTLTEAPTHTTTVTTITKTAGNLKVVFDGNDKYEVFLVPDSSGNVGGSNTVFACTAFTYSGDYNTSLQNIDTSPANSQALLSGTDTTTLLTNNHLCNGANVSTVLLADVQTGFDKLHRVTWFKTGEKFAASTDYKIMQLKHTGTKLVGTLELYYGDGTNGDQKKYIVSFTNDTTVAISATTIANPPPFRKYYVRVIAGADPKSDPYYEFSNKGGNDFTALNDASTPLTIYKRATYVFERDNTTTTGHPFNVRVSTTGPAATTGLFKTHLGINNPPTTTAGLTLAGEKLLMFTTEDYDGTVEYFCTSHPTTMKKDFDLTAQTNDSTTTGGGYDALVDADRHIEIGRNIRLEIEGEEIIL